MIKKIYSIIPFLIFCNFSFGQNKFSEKILSECKIMADAMLQKNYSTIIDYTYPKIVEMGGGKAALLKASGPALKKMDSGFELNYFWRTSKNLCCWQGITLHCS